MTTALGVVLVCLIATAPLLIAVAAAVFSSDPRRRADARQVVVLLRPRQPPRRVTDPADGALASPRFKTYGDDEHTCTDRDAFDTF